MPAKPDVFVNTSVTKATTDDGAVKAEFLLPGDLQVADLLYSMGQQGREPRYASFVEAVKAVIQGRKTENNDPNTSAAQRRENEKLIVLLEEEIKKRQPPTAL